MNETNKQEKAYKEDPIDTLDKILSEADPLKQSAALNKLMIDISKRDVRNQKIQWIIISALVGLCIIMVIVTSYDNMKMRREVVSVVENSQSQLIDFLKTYEFVIEETTTTTTYDQEVSGEEATLINGNQYKDSATHNQGVDDEWVTQDNELQPNLEK